MQTPSDFSGRVEVSWVKPLAIVILILAVIYVVPRWTRSMEADTHHDAMVALCAGSQECLAAVEQHADNCFLENYPMGRRNQSLKTEDVVACINRRAGKVLLTVVPTAQ